MTTIDYTNVYVDGGTDIHPIMIYFIDYITNIILFYHHNSPEILKFIKRERPLIILTGYPYHIHLIRKSNPFEYFVFVIDKDKINEFYSNQLEHERYNLIVNKFLSE